MLGNQKITYVPRCSLKVFLFLIVSPFVGVFSPLHAHGTIEEVPSLGQLAKESTLVFFGNVEDIVYRNSEPTEQEPFGIPHAACK